MKLTKEYLKNIISEEIQKISESSLDKYDYQTDELAQLVNKDHLELYKNIYEINEKLDVIDLFSRNTWPIVIKDFLQQPHYSSDLKQTYLEGTLKYLEKKYSNHPGLAKAIGYVKGLLERYANKA